MPDKAVTVQGTDVNNYQYRWVVIGNPAVIKSVVKTFKRMLNGDVPEEKPDYIRQSEDVWSYNKEQAEHGKLRIQNFTEFVEVDERIQLYSLMPEPEVIE